MKTKIDYLIVGQGLTGTYFAHQLLQKGKSFLVVDKGHEESSSSIAAGIINPMVLKRLTTTWRAKEFLGFNSLFYPDVENLLGKSYLFEVPMDKLINTESDADYWSHRFDKVDLDFFAKRKLINSERKDISANFFSYGRVKHTSWVNIGELLSDYRLFLLRQNKILEEKFDFDLLTGLQYKNILFKQIVFCEGAHAKNNPFFNFLPFSLNKGQLITIKSDQLSEESILKKKVFILPVGEGKFKVGSTFSWEWDHDQPETAKTNELKKGLEEIIGSNYSISNEFAGIRPASRDRRPLIGRHPTQAHYYIFNGMGAKGCLMAPLLCQEFYDFIEHNEPLNPEADINRFKRS